MMYTANQNQGAITVTFSYTALVNEYSSDCVVVIFFSFYFHFPNALQSDNNTNAVLMFLGINIFWTLLSPPFSPHLMAQTKMSLSQAHLYAYEHNLFCFIT